MSGRKMFVAPRFKPELLERLLHNAPDWDIAHGRKPEEAADFLREAEVIVGWHPSMEAVCLRPDGALRWVQVWSAGVDSMPLHKLEEHGVMLSSANGVHPYPISETIFAMMLAFARKLHISVRNQANREWKKTGMLGEIHGRTIGILGVGSIGQETARLAQAFGMRVLGVRRSGEPAEHVDEMFRLDRLKDMLGQADYVVNTLPLTEETRMLIGAEAFAAMKPTACYINIGRGKTTDTEALTAALLSGRLGGAGLDVVDPEPLPGDHPLWDMDNVILTPHNSGITEYYNERAMDIFLANLRDYAEGRKPGHNLVDYRIGY